MLEVFQPLNVPTFLFLRGFYSSRKKSLHMTILWHTFIRVRYLLSLRETSMWRFES